MTNWAIASSFVSFIDATILKNQDDSKKITFVQLAINIIDDFKVLTHIFNWYFSVVRLLCDDGIICDFLLNTYVYS